MMPNFTFQDKNTDERHVEFFSTNTQKETYLEENPHLKQMVVPLPFTSQHGSTLSKTSGDWRDHLKNIKAGAGKDNTIKV